MTMVLDGLYQRGGQPVGPIAVGNIYYVYDTNSTDSATYINKRFSGQTYDDDNSELLHPHTATSAPVVTTDGFTSALAATVAGRNDYVVVMPTEDIYHDYYINALLTMSKKAVHLVCPAGMGPEVGASQAAIMWQKSDLDLIDVTGMSIEIAGLGFVNYNSQSAIVLSEHGRHVNIHHNTFLLWWLSGAQVGAIVGSGGGGGWGCISKNWFVGWGCGSVTCAAGVVYLAGQATGARVSYNEVTIGDNGIMSVGINNQAIKGMTAFNIFSESGGMGSAEITKAVGIYPYAAAIGNLAAVADGKGLTGGTADTSYVENYEASNGGVLSV